MSTDVARNEEFGALTREQIELVKKKVAIGASDDELALFLHQCKKAGLDPLSYQIYWIKRGGEGRTQIAIGGARLVAERTGHYSPGHTYWYDENGKQTEVWLEEKPPAAARVTVFKDGVEVPGRAVAFKERVQNTPTWKSMPATMLAKCAEMDTLRTAFPQELSGLYSPEEMGNGHPASPAPRRIEKEILVGENMVATEQVAEIDALLDKLVEGGSVKRDALLERLHELYGTTDLTKLTRSQANEVLERLRPGVTT